MERLQKIYLQIMSYVVDLFKSPFFNNKRISSAIWILIAIVVALKQYILGSYNNYKIFKHVFYHTLEQLPIYELYPDLYQDHNHYGPLFSILIAPFALIPDAVGMVFWNIANASLLLYAIWKLPLNAQKINLILWISAHEFLTTSLSYQFNPMMTAIIILSFVFMHQKKDFWAAMFIIFGTFIKLYGIVGLAFFFFSKTKIKFILSLVFWTAIFFVLPMFISSPEFIINAYSDWYHRLVEKNNANIVLGNMQDISLMGFIRRILGNPNISTIPILLFGLFLFGLTYLKVNYYKDLKYRLLLLSSVLIFTVIFSSGAESPTYIIAFLGVAIWFVIQEKPIHPFYVFAFIFAMILTSFSPSDLIPRFIREQYVIKYSLKALPVVIIWFIIVYQMLQLKTLDSIVENHTQEKNIL